jgi:hypothetical protein
MLAGWVWRDDGLDPPPSEHVPQTSGVISAIGEKPLGLMSHRQQAVCALRVVDVPNRGLDLGRLPATRTADGAVERPFCACGGNDGP